MPRIIDAKPRLHSCWNLDAIGIFMGGGQKMAYLVNTAPGVAERRFSHHVVSKEGGTDLRPAIVIMGAPAKMKVVRWVVEDYDRAADGYAPVEEGLEVDMNGGFLSAHALRTGRFKFKLPFPCRVVNLKTGLPAKVKGDVLPLGLVAGETCWFKLTPIR